jgi:hypothetical protein
MKELVSDNVYEASMLTRLDQTKVKIEKMISEWNLLGFRQCDNESMLYDLAYNAQQMIAEGKQLKQADGDNLSPEQKKAYMDKLSFREPHDYKVAAHAVQQDAFAERGQNLWSIKSGKVVLNKKASEEITKSRSVIAKNERQEDLGNKVIELKELFDEINKRTYGYLRVNMNDIFVRDLRENGSYTPASLNIEMLKRIINHE